MLNLNEQIKTKIKSIKQELINIRRDIHSHPELGMQEFRTMNLISEYLAKHNIKHRTKVANTGIIADIEGEDKSFTVAFRADMDALPLEDLKKCDYASKNKGLCHACGHDVHTTINMGIANIFSNTDENKIVPPCNVRLIFQPAEENEGGALPMMKENALENVNVIYGLHVASNADIGTVQVADNIMHAACLDFIIKVYGKKAHGAEPANGVDAIVISSKIINDLQTIISRNVDAEDCAIITIGKIKGGTATNIICDYVEIEGTIRTLKDSTMNTVKSRVKKVIKNISNAFDGDAEFIEVIYYASVVNWKDASDIIRENAINLLGNKNVSDLKPSLGSEDFAFFIQNKPGTFFNIGTRNKNKGITAQVHNGLFDVDEDAIEIGLTMQIMNLYSAYNKKEIFPLGRER